MKILDLGFKDFTNNDNITKYYSYICTHALDSGNNLGNELKGDYINLPDLKVVKSPMVVDLYKDDKKVAIYKFMKGIDGGCTFIPKDDKYVVYVLHHIDMDGIVSASIVYNAINPVASKCYSYNYNMSDEYRMEFSKRFDGYKKLMIVTDLSLNTNDIDFILSHFDKVVWLDHHGTSINTIESILRLRPQYENKLFYAIDTRFSASYLNYTIFKDLIVGNLNAVFPALVSVYDTKQNKVYPHAYRDGLKLNQYFNDIEVLRPQSSLWTKLLYSNDGLKSEYSLLDKVLEVGEQLLSIYETRNTILYKNEYKYIFKYRNYTIKCINGVGNSLRFCNDAELDIAMIARMKDDYNFTLSAYSDSDKVKSMDIGRVFKKYFTGGGHPGAAGYTSSMNDILYDLQNCIYNDRSIIMDENEGLFRDILKELKSQYPAMDKEIYPYEEGTINRVEPNMLSIFFYTSLVLFYELHLNR